MNDPLRQAYAIALTAEGPADGPPVDLERILDALQGVSGPDEVAAVVDLTIEHLSWARAWAEARAMVATQASEAPAAVDASYETPAPANRPWIWGVAAVALAAAALLVVSVARQPADNPYREQGAQSIQVRSPDSVPRAAATLAWEAPATARVELQVFDEQFEPLAHTAGMGIVDYTVPVDALTGIEPGGKLIWSLKITAADGRLTTSPSFRTTLQD